MSTFQSALSEAHEIENKLKNLIERNPNCIVATSQDKGSFSNYDLLVRFSDGKPDLTIEVKSDKMVHITKNVAVELYRIVNGQRRDTCLNATKSDIYAYYFNGQFHLIETKKLKMLVNNKDIRVVSGGDGKRARCALLPIETFLKHAEVFN